MWNCLSSSGICYKYETEKLIIIQMFVTSTGVSKKKDIKDKAKVHNPKHATIGMPWITECSGTVFNLIVLLKLDSYGRLRCNLNTDTLV